MGNYLILHQKVLLHTLWSDGILADMPPCLGGGDYGINIA